MGWDGKIGFFLHTPFPASEVFSMLPWARPLLSSLLEYDLIGVHIRRYLRNLTDTLADEVGGAQIGDAFLDGRRSVKIIPCPIGIDAEQIARLAHQVPGSSAGQYLRRLSPDHSIILGVDRLDYTKGVWQRLLTFEYLLEHYPALRGRVSMIQISAPSRSRVPEYVEERR
jgi:trehalose-6-phosphate synthase